LLDGGQDASDLAHVVNVTAPHMTGQRRGIVPREMSASRVGVASSGVCLS
jgi:hypothetical protein